jgi:hypothetical protein
MKMFTQNEPLTDAELDRLGEFFKGWQGRFLKWKRPSTGTQISAESASRGVAQGTHDYCAR